jgi:beta-lactamase superfamily II metal-dependent hydrolase
VISCGASNVYAHPHAETLARLSARNVALLRTDRDGTVTITRTGRGARIRWQRAFPSASAHGAGDGAMAENRAFP